MQIEATPVPRPPRWQMVLRGSLAALVVPLFVTLVYELFTPSDLPVRLWAAVPFLIILLGAGLIAQARDDWKDVAVGLVVGAVLYGLFLVLVLWYMSRTAGLF